MDQIVAGFAANQSSGEGKSLEALCQAHFSASQLCSCNIGHFRSLPRDGPSTTGRRSQSIVYQMACQLLEPGLAAPPSQAALKRQDEATKSTHSQNISAILELPVEIMDEIATRLHANDLLHFRHSCRALHAILAAPDPSTVDLKLLRHVLKTESFYRRVHRPEMCGIIKDEWPCGACKALHPARAFFSSQLMKPPLQRRCAKARRIFRLCAHESFDFGELISHLSYLRDAEPQARLKCWHSDHVIANGPFEMTMYPKLDLEGIMTGAASVTATQNHPVAVLPEPLEPWRLSYYLSDMVKSSLMELKARMCPHLSSNHKYVLHSWTWMNTYSRRWRNPKTIQKCTVDGCSMEFWFERHRPQTKIFRTKIGGLTGSTKISGPGEGTIWLHVQRCHLQFPLTAEDKT